MEDTEKKAIIDRMNEERLKCACRWHNDKYWLGYTDAMRKAVRIVDVTIDDEPMYAAQNCEKIIHCCDCLYWQDAEDGIVEMPICERNTTKHTGMIGGHFFPAGPDDFCSFAKRKDNK